MKEVNDKIFLLIEELKRLGFIDFESDFCENIGLLKQNLNNIKQGRMNFNLKHVHKIIYQYNVNPDWIFGLENNMFRKVKAQ